MTADDTQPPDERAYCDCVGAMVRHRWQHARDCLHWAPTPRGPGSTDEARIRYMAEISAAIDEARRRHQAAPESAQNDAGRDQHAPEVS